MSNENSISIPNQPEPWRRLWLPTGTWDQFRGIDEEFLSDHGGKGGIENAWSDSLQGINYLSGYAGVPFLVLLGRPGSGKSWELREAEKNGWLGESSVLVEGKEIGAVNPAVYFQTALAGILDQPTRLIIDGLDEVMLENPQFVPQLKAWFRRNVDAHGRPRHSLAISCRWADWPEAQIADLGNLWPVDESKTLVLAPLRHTDAVETLTRRFREEEAELFLRQLRELRLFPVACWPQGFLSLVRQFDDSGRENVASSHADVIRAEIFRRCRLADSPDDSMRWQQSVEGTEWRRQIAGRLAATMIFSGRSNLALDATTERAEDGVLSPADLGFTDESWEGQRVTPKLVDFDSLVHRTSLLRRIGTKGRWIFESQVHQEWLAADWLAARKLGISRLKQIFGVDMEWTWTVAPPMRATAAWLARFDRDFRDLVLRHDPLTLLRMDGASLPDSEREEIVEELLKATDDIRVVDPAIWHAHLPSLKHHGLARQLERWLIRPDATEAAKRLALELAEKTDLIEIGDVLWQVYATSGKTLRPEIAGALLRLAKEGHDDKWQAVLNGEIPIDAHGTLLGAAMRIMVIDSPKVPVREILQHVLPELRFEVFGTYQMAIRRLHDRMTVEDLSPVFKRLVENPRAIRNQLSRAKEFNDAAIRLAIREIGRQEIGQALVEYWYACLDRHVVPGRGVADLWLGKDVERRGFARSLVKHENFERHRADDWVSSANYCLDEADFEWCLDQLETEVPAEAWRFAVLASTMIWRVDLSGSTGQKLNKVCRICAALKGLLPTPMAGESISQAVTRLAAENQAKREAKNDHSKKRQEQRSEALGERMKKYEEQCKEAHEGGKLVWPEAFIILMFRRTGETRGAVTFQPILEIGPDDDWMLEAALRFMIESPRKSDFGSNYDLYGLLALAACCESLDYHEELWESVSKDWLIHLIPRICNYGLEELPAAISNEQLARLFPEVFVRSFGGFCRSAYRNGSSLSELHQLVGIKLTGLSAQLKSVLMEEPLQSAGFFTGMWFLARVDEESAIEVALHWLPELGGELPRDVAASLLGAAAILVNGRLSGEIETHLSDTLLVFDSIRAAASKLAWHEREMDFSGWSDHSLKMLGDAVWRAYPMSDRLRSRRGTFEFHGVTDEDQAMEFRDRLSSAAWSRGIDIVVPESCDGESEEDSESRRHMIDWHRHSNLQTRAGASWMSLAPAEFLKLADQPHARLARNQDELLAAVIECLERWEAAMENQGTWDHLWDAQTSRHEKRIAREMRNWLKRELDVLVECEIELASEDRSDVVVQTVPPDGVSPSITVVIELKKHRSSNAKERRTSMKSQLVDRYLHERAGEGWTHGLYVVAWTPKPGSRADSNEAMERERQQLEQQAKGLNVPPYTIKSMVIDARYRGKVG